MECEPWVRLNGRRTARGVERADSTLSPHPLMASMAKASVASARTLNLSPVDALFECCLEWKDASSEVWQA